MKQKIHLIAIGGAVMHNMALALHKMGFEVSGSDDQIFEPAKTRLQNANLLPPNEGWDISKITPDLHCVILGMHAKADNPELLHAQHLGLKIYSFPEFVFEHAKNKKRLVVAGSHGKTSITAIIMHVLQHANVAFDYLVGSQLDGFSTMVQLSDAPLIVIEGDEYLSSAIDRRPKFWLYHATHALISGIAWDHMNVFPTEENYQSQFGTFVANLPKNAPLAYFVDDSALHTLIEKNGKHTNLIAYSAHDANIINGKTLLKTPFNKTIPISIFGKHNLENLNGARLLLNTLGITDDQFYAAIPTFKGAANRLETWVQKEDFLVIRDFAHAPSKVLATVNAVKQQYPKQKLLAILELHTFSSLNPAFLPQYKKSMANADDAWVYFNPKTVAQKNGTLTENEVIAAFDQQNLRVFTDSNHLKNELLAYTREKSNWLIMSSGNFNNLPLKELANFAD